MDAPSESPTVVASPNRIFLGVALLGALGVGYMAGSLLGGKAAKPSACGDEAAIKASVTKSLTDAGVLMPVAPVMSVTGRITAVEGRTVTLEVANLNQNPLVAETPKVRQVTLADDASIKMLFSISESELTAAWKKYQAQQETFMKAIEKGESMEAPTPPGPMGEKDITLAELKAGMSATVMAATDVREAAAFNANGIIVDEPEVEAAVPPMPDQVAPATTAATTP